ncbi:MAG: asparagine synthase-related protein [Sciscionella sp.]
MDVAALARLFTGLALTGEFLPGAFWRDVRLEWELPGSSAVGESFPAVFTTAVATLCGDTDMVGVKLSGGLDSFAVLCHVVALSPERRIIAFCVDLVDDCGVSTSSVVRRLLDRLCAAAGVEVELVVVDPQHCAARPVWSSHGPRLDSLPAVNATIAGLATQRGVPVLLGGDGADELLAVPQYATAPVIRAYGLCAGERYLADARRSGPGWAGEMVALLADRFPPRARARWYWAANWPGWCAATVSPVVRPVWREQALAWADDWITARLEEHMQHGRRWWAADAADAF